jgi:hypothetical protein
MQKAQLEPNIKSSLRTPWLPTKASEPEATSEPIYQTPQTSQTTIISSTEEKKTTSLHMYLVQEPFGGQMHLELDTGLLSPIADKLLLNLIET